jgi:hypothetical protein
MHVLSSHVGMSNAQVRSMVFVCSSGRSEFLRSVYPCRLLVADTLPTAILHSCCHKIRINLSDKSVLEKLDVRLPDWYTAH